VNAPNANVLTYRAIGNKTGETTDLTIPHQTRTATIKILYWEMYRVAQTPTDLSVKNAIEEFVK
jgi:hypothetical protein